MEAGSIAFIIIAASMVFFMTPGLAFFYGGLGRRKNVINTMMMAVVPIAIAVVLWFLVGYSLSFSGDHLLIGDFNFSLLSGVSETSSTRDLVIPDLLFSMFQMMFSIISVGILTGSVVGRIRFTAMLLFMPLWLLFIYYPLAHMVWGGGLLEHWGSIDFAGGDVVHISSGVTGLVLALVLKSRKEFGIHEYRPHNVPFVFLGTAILSFGWFGFNAGSSLAADGLAIHSLATTMLAASAAMLSWLILEYVLAKKVSLVGASTGLIAGLVAITPGAGFVSLGASLLIGLFVSPICYFAIAKLKHKFGYDDALDAFGCHGIGGLFGGLVTGIFTLPELALDSDYVGWLYGDSKLFFANLYAAIFTIIWTAVISFVLIKVVSFFTDLRVSHREEAIGLDDSEHAETAYPTFMGLDS